MITELYNKIYQDESSNDPKRFLALIEPEIELLMAQELLDIDERIKFTRLLTDYSVALYNSGFVKKSLPFMNYAIAIIEKDESLKGDNLFDVPLYETLIQFRGDAYFHSKQFSLAKKDFRKLLTRWPDNDRFKNGYNASACHILNQIEWAFGALTVFCFFAFYPMNLKNSLTIYVLLIGLVGGVSTHIYKRIIKIK